MTKETLKQWYLFYIKNRDLMLKKIRNVEQKEDIITIHNKEGTKESSIVASNPTSFTALLSQFNETDKISIITLNKKDIINLLIKEWKDIVNYTALTMMFVNPDSEQDKKWIIKPHFHHRFTDPSALKSGIMSIASSVDMI